jgi:hypothetical protein
MTATKLLISGTLALGLATGSAYAQSVNANNLVNVNVSNVANEIAKNLSVDVQDVIDLGAVQAPIGVAANVCGVDANVLAEQSKGSSAECTAQSSSQALTQVVQRQLNAS